MLLLDQEDVERTERFQDVADLLLVFGLFDHADEVEQDVDVAEQVQDPDGRDLFWFRVLDDELGAAFLDGHQDV